MPSQGDAVYMNRSVCLYAPDIILFISPAQVYIMRCSFMVRRSCLYMTTRCCFVMPRMCVYVQPRGAVLLCPGCAFMYNNNNNNTHIYNAHNVER